MTNIKGLFLSKSHTGRYFSRVTLPGLADIGSSFNIFPKKAKKIIIILELEGQQYYRPILVLEEDLSVNSVVLLKKTYVPNMLN